MKSKDLYPAVFSRHAEAYQRRLEEVMARGEARGRMRLIELAAARPGMRILDLACGPGNLTRRLAAQVGPGGEVLGVDLAPGMIALARAAGIPNARFELMDIEQLTFADEFFDAAVCGHGLQFAPDLARALGESRRVLKSGSRLAASVPVEAVKESVWELIDAVIERWLPPAPRAVDQLPTRTTVRDAGALRQAALDAGFRAADIEVVEEVVTWESAQHLVSMCMGWWDCAARLEGIDPSTRRGFMDDAIATLEQNHHGPIETTGRNHVLAAER